MYPPANQALVSTMRERCRTCYTCVRECPAKAIRISSQQAEVIPERCIACGNCVRVCSQHAKEIWSNLPEVEELLASGARVAACVAPSFPAEFMEWDERQLAGMLRALGFSIVQEVAFGADLVAREYNRLLARKDGRRYIATTCPAIIAYVERYMPHLLEALAPIVSPMVASARALRRLHGADLRVVFIGPCIAKKGELRYQGGRGEIEAVLTYVELRQLLSRRGVTPAQAPPGDFDPPHPGLGALFPVGGGMLEAAGIRADLTAGEAVRAEGRTDFVDALKEFESGHFEARLLEVLCCTGCVMGAGMSSREPIFSRRTRISQYVRRRQAGHDAKAWRETLEALGDLDLSRTYLPHDLRLPVPSQEELERILARMGKLKPEDELNCGACGYDTCREHAIAIIKGLAESEMCLPFTIEKLRQTNLDLALSNMQLATTQEELMHSQRLASMGQLAAGIAHEVNNPLGVVLMYSHLLLEECPSGSPLRQDLATITEQADRCKKIVAGLLNFARQNKVHFQDVDVRELVARALRAAPPPENVQVVQETPLADPLCELDGDQMTQVLTNLFTNAYAAMPQGGTLTVRASGDAVRVQFIVRDTGVGIPRENLPKIFEPFFTTKKIGMGTGLGLAVTYGIVKMHRGDIKVESNADSRQGPLGTVFTVAVPRRAHREEDGGS